MRDWADIIIVGGGISGCAIFYELSRSTSLKVMLLEKNCIASGSTAQSGGFIRKFNTDAYLRRLADDSFDYYQHFARHVGGSCGFRTEYFQYRLPYPLSDETQACIEGLQASGYPLSLSLSSSECVVNESMAASIDPKSACRAWVNAAVRHNGIVYQRTSVDAILTENARIYGVQTTRGDIMSTYVVLSAGIMSAAILDQLDIKSDITVKSFQYHVYKHAAHLVDSSYIDLIDGYYLLPLRSGDAIAGRLSEDRNADPVSVGETAVDYQVDTMLHQLVSQRIQGLREYAVSDIKTGYDAFTTDERGMVNVMPQVAGLIVASGWSGGGVKLAPAIAKKVLAIIQQDVIAKVC
jgi:glycine/D-amino acid oxidase-like deaminating enzyme